MSYNINVNSIQYFKNEASIHRWPLSPVFCPLSPIPRPCPKKLDESHVTTSRSSLSLEAGSSSPGFSKQGSRPTPEGEHAASKASHSLDTCSSLRREWARTPDTASSSSGSKSASVCSSAAAHDPADPRRMGAASAEERRSRSAFRTAVSGRDSEHVLRM